MPKRTKDAHKAILDAWKLEADLIQEGKGTRDWTAQQQKDILEKGKAYDDDGVAFHGHHMRSAEKHPECQGDPQNIQFLTRDEHLEAHGGCWQNPTNGCFDPTTKTTLDFGDGPVKPCDKITLSDPIALPKPIGEPHKEAAAKVPEETAQGPPQQVAEKPETALAKTQTVKPAVKAATKMQEGFLARAGSRIEHTAEAVVRFAVKHKKEIVAAAVIARGLLSLGEILNENRQSKGGGSSDGLDIDFNKYSDDAIPSEIGAKSDPEPEDNSSFGVEEESSGGRHAIDESEYEKQKRLIHGTPCNLPKGQKASERARKNAEDDGYELEEGKTYRVTHQMDVWCKKKNEE